MLTCHYGQATMERTLYTANKYLEVEGQLEIPAEYPELVAVLSCHGYLSEINGQISGNKLFLSGTVETHLVYRGQAQLDQIPEYGLIQRGTDGAVFNGEINLPDLDGDWDWQARLVKIKVQPNTSRMLKYQLELEVKLRAREVYAVNYIDEIEAEAKVNTEVEYLLIEEPVLQTYVNREINNHFPLTYPKPPLARLLSCQVCPVNSGAIFTKDRVNIEGKLEVHLVYVTLGEDGQEVGVEAQKWTEENGGAIPFQITVETPMLEDPSVHYELWVEEVQFTSTHPESCRIQAKLGASIGLTKTRQVKAIIDVTPDGEGLVDLKREAGTWVEVMEETERQITVEKTLAIPANQRKIRDILQLTVAQPKIEWQLTHDQLLVTGEAFGTLLYQGESSEDEGVSLETFTWGQGGAEPITFGTYLELPGVEEEMQARIFLNTNQYKVEQIDERTIKLLLELKACLTVTQIREISLITDSALVLPEEGRKPSLLFYLVQPGDTLWKIARRYNTTMETIAQANRLSDPERELVFGKKLLIPKQPIISK